MSWIGTNLIWLAVGLAGAVALHVYSKLFHDRAERRHAERLAELEAGAPEAYFEERRSRLAYPPEPFRLSWWRVGATLLAVALGYLFFES